MYTRYATTLAMLAMIAALCAGCSGKSTSRAARSQAVKHNSQHKHEHGHMHGHGHGHGHKSVHGGSLNAIVTCENGHAEVKIDGDKMQLWFVGGGPNTNKSVRVPDKSIKLQVKTDSGAKTLVLSPKPLDLAGEKVGDCSHFEGTAPWISGLAEFSAEGQITFRNKQMPLKIEYPNGYDPD